MDEDKLLQTLELAFSTRDRELTCEDYRAEDLALYAESTMTGRMEEPEISGLAQHLRRCPDCAAEYESLVRLLSLDRSDALAEPEGQPSFDLSFLSDAPQLWMRVEGAIRRLTYELPLNLFDELQRLSAGTPGLQVRYAATGGRRIRHAEHGERSRSYEMKITDPDENLRLDITTTLHVAEKTISLLVRPLDKEKRKALEGARVALYDEQARPLEIRSLGLETGAAQFQNINLGRRYTLRLEHEERSWEIPLDLEGARDLSPSP